MSDFMEPGAAKEEARKERSAEEIEARRQEIAANVARIKAERARKQAEEAEAAAIREKVIEADPSTVALMQKRLEELQLEKESNLTENRYSLPNENPIKDEAARTLKDIIDTQNREKFENKRLSLISMQEGNAHQSSKALPAQFYHQEMEAFDACRSAIRHHVGSHYHMAGSVQFQRG
jgi:hypothetical protein